MNHDLARVEIKFSDMEAYAIFADVDGNAFIIKG